MARNSSQQISRRTTRSLTAFLLGIPVFLSIAPLSAPGFDRADEIKALARQLEDRGVAVSLYAVRGTDSPQVLNLNGDVPSNPASVQKLLVTGAGLLALGPDFRFHTRLMTTSPVEGASLPGPLIVVGEGDPSLAGRWNDGDPAQPLKRWAAALHGAGIRRVDGNIVGHDDFFADEPFAPGWDDYTHTDWYTAPVSALSLNDNCIDIRIRPEAKIGWAPAISLVPDTSYVTVNSKMNTKARRSGWVIGVERPRGTNNITLTGRAAHGQSSRVEYVTIHNPTLFTATVFHEVLEKAGIMVDGVPVDFDDLPGSEKRASGLMEASGWITMATHSSPPLSEVIIPINENSQNLYAELLLKRLGVARMGEGTFAAGTAAVREVWQKAGLDVSRLKMVDGSGLSRQNMTTPQTIVEALRIMARTAHDETYRKSMAVAGYEGSLHSRFDGTPLAKKLLAKTGYLNGTRTLAGYLPGKNGNEVTFAMFLQGPTGAVRDGRREMDRMVVLLGE